MKETAALLRNKGIKPSMQRIQIYHYLKDRTDHPSVDMIFSSLVPKIPTLSKTTVYNTLKSLAGAGLAQPIRLEEKEIRYDPDIRPHGHFICESCENIFDFRVDFSTFDAPELKNYQIRQRHVYLKGLCETCQNIAFNQQNQKK